MVELVNFFANLGRGEGTLHEMGGGGDGSHDRDNEGEASCQGDRVCFPTGKLIS